MNKFLIIPVLSLALLLGASSVMAEEGADDPVGDDNNRPVMPFPRHEIREERREDRQEFRESASGTPGFWRERAHGVFERCQAHADMLRERVANAALLSDNEKEALREVYESRKERYRELSTTESRMEDGALDARANTLAGDCRRMIYAGASMMANDRIVAVGEQMEQFIAKLIARLDVMAEGGTDVSAQKAALADIQSDIDAAQALAQEIRGLLDASGEIDGETVRAKVKEAHELFKSAREALRALVEEIKGAKSE